MIKAKGFNVTRGRLRPITMIKMSILITIYVLAIIISFIYAEKVIYLLYLVYLVNIFIVLKYLFKKKAV